MKTAFSRFIAVILVIFIGFILFFQNPALAGRLSDPDSAAGVTSRPGGAGSFLKGLRWDVFWKALEPGVANPVTAEPEGRMPKDFDRPGKGGEIDRNNSAGERMERNQREGKNVA
jgi:hypothetical protein